MAPSENAQKRSNFASIGNFQTITSNANPIQQHSQPLGQINNVNNGLPNIDYQLLQQQLAAQQQMLSQQIQMPTNQNPSQFIPNQQNQHRGPTHHSTPSRPRNQDFENNNQSTVVLSQ